MYAVCRYAERVHCIAWKFNNSKWNKYKHELHAKRKLTRNKLDSNHVVIYSFAHSQSLFHLYGYDGDPQFDVALWCDMATKLRISAQLFCNIHFDHNLLWITIFLYLFVVVVVVVGGGTIHMALSLIWVAFWFHSFSSYFFLSFGKPRESFLLFFQMINRKLFDFVAFAIGHQMYHIPSIKSSAHSGIFHIAISIRCRCFHLEILGNMWDAVLLHVVNSTQYLIFFYLFLT